MAIFDTGSPPSDINDNWLGFGNYQFDSSTVIRFFNRFAENAPGYVDTDRLELSGEFQTERWHFHLVQNFGYNVRPTISLSVHKLPRVDISMGGESKQESFEVPVRNSGETAVELAERWLCTAYNRLLAMVVEVDASFRFTKTCEELLGRIPTPSVIAPGEPYILSLSSLSSESSSSSSSSSSEISDGFLGSSSSSSSLSSSSSSSESSSSSSYRDNAAWTTSSSSS